jgi:hypothetical protein
VQLGVAVDPVKRAAVTGREETAMVGAVLSRSRPLLALVGGAGVLLTGCSSIQGPDVEKVAATFEDPSGDPEQRCGLLAPSALAALEEDQSSPCAEAIQQLPLQGGEVTRVEIWGGEAQVRIGGDTVFLTETHAGWRVAAAACEARGEGPYDCEVEGP